MLDMSTVDICKANVIFSPDVEMLLINNLLYRLDCSDQVNKLVLITMPDLFNECERLEDYVQPICGFSSCHDYVLPLLF